MFAAGTIASVVSAITPSDTATQNFMALYVGVTGNVSISTQANTVVTFANVPVGFFPVSGNKVMATNTTASQIIGLS